MDRREFFKFGVNKVHDLAEIAEKKERARQAKQWVRPPYALDEEAFLDVCTRCDQCRQVCPTQVIFSLPIKYGLQIKDTPALDLNNKSCLLCKDWPCVSVCEPNALNLPINETEEDQATQLPKLAIAHINIEQCLPYQGPECGACNDICPVPQVLIFDMNKPTIDSEHCIGCGQCRQVCIADPKAIEIKSVN